MAWNSLFQNGLLGMGGISGGQQSMPANSLLGQYYDPAAMRNYQMKQMLLGLGAGLMSQKGLGAGATLALAAGDRAGQNYRQDALDAYRLKQAQDEQAYQHGRDAKSDANAERDYKLRLDEYNRQKAWTDTNNQHTLEGWQQQEDQQNAQKNYVTGWMNDRNRQGANILPQGIRDIARSGGVDSTMSPTDEWRYNNATPYVGAQDYGNAFNQIAAQPQMDDKAPTVQTIYDDRGNEQKVQWNGKQWVPVGGAKPPSGGITVSPDGTVQVGGPSGKPTSDDKRASTLATQILGQEPQLMAGFDSLASPQNYAGSKVPGGSAIMSPEAQVAQDAITNTVANWLYLTSGATATDAEIERQTAMVTPSPMDSPQRIAAKKARLKSIFDTMRVRGGVTSTDPAPSDAAQSGPSDPSNPQPGDVVLGYRFKGGNRRDPNNWEKVQ